MRGVFFGSFVVLLLIFFGIAAEVRAQSPGGVSGMNIWLKADAGTYEDSGLSDATEDGDTILSWDDQSTNNRDATEASSTPTWLESSINFNPAINFDGTSEFVGLDNTTADATFGGLTTMSYFMAQHTDTPTPVNEISFFDDSNQGVNDEIAFGQDPTVTGSIVNGYFVDSGFDVYYTIRSNIISDTPTILGTTWHDTSAASTSIRVDGHAEPMAYFLDTFNGGIATGDIDFFRFGQGLGTDLNRQYDGRMGEFVMYNSVLSETDVQKVESYMGLKYGVTLIDATTTGIISQLVQNGASNQTNPIAQSFTAEATTTVDGIRIEIWNNSMLTAADLHFCTGEATATACVASPDHTTSAVSVTPPGSGRAFVDILFSTPQPIFTGQQYTIAIVQNNAMTYQINSSNPYAGGQYSLAGNFQSGDLVFEIIGLDEEPFDYILSDSTNVWSASANSAYHNDVAGLVRDTGSALDQKVARSTESDSLVIMATDQDFSSTNATGLRTSLTNGQAFVWGNDNGTTTITGTYDGNTNKRISRIWKVDETGGVGNVYVAIPNTAGFTSTSFVVISNDTTFDSSDTVTTLTDDGTHLYAQINPSDGQFFSFAQDPTPTLKIEFASSTASSSENVGANTPVLRFSGINLASSETVDVVITGGTATSSDHTFSATTTLTIPAADYTSSTGTLAVTGAITNDAIAELDETITFSIVSATSAIVVGDATGDGMTNATHTYTIVNDDAAGITLSATSSSIVEDATTTYTVVLDTQPTATVVVTLATSSSEASLSPTSLTFTTGNYNVAQTITITGTDDLLADGSQVVTITHTASSGDTFYNGATSSNYTVTVNDNDTASVTITPTTLSVTEGGATSTYTIVLGAQPTTTVTVALATTTGQASISTTSLTFTTGNYNVAQTVVVTAVEEAVVDGTTTETVTHTLTSGDTAYNGLAASSAVATVFDNDSLPVASIVSPTNNAVVSTSTSVVVQCNGVGHVYTLTGNFTPSPATTTCAAVGTTSIGIIFPATSTAQTIAATVQDTASNTSATVTVSGLLVDEDGDGVSSQFEDAGANSGDGNGDGIRDALQSNVLGAVNSLADNDYTTLAATGTCTFIEAIRFVTESSLGVEDSAAEYPVGLADFRLRCPNPGDTANVTLYYTQNYDTSSWIYKKFDSGSNSYSDITIPAGVTIGTATVGTSTITTITYGVTDGSAVTDEDGLTDAFINDPSGPAFAVTTDTNSGTVSGGYVCRDPEAINDDGSGRCVYEETVVEAVEEEVTGICAPYLNDFIELGALNDVEQVKKLEMFLNTYEGEALSVDGIYDDTDFQAVKRFQEKYRTDVLDFWDLSEGSGWVYFTTKAKINALVCAHQKPDLVCPYFDYANVGDTGSSVDKIQAFLNNLGESLSLTGVYDVPTQDAVKRFQSAHPELVLDPWGLTTPTGYFYQSTRKEAHRYIGCFEPPIRLDNGVVLE